VVDVGELVERELAVEGGLREARLRERAARLVVGAGRAVRDQAAPAGDLLHARVDQAREEARLERLAEVAHPVELGPGPRALEALGVAGERALGGVVLGERLGQRLGASMPDFSARWMPLRRAMFTKPPVSPTSTKPSPKSFGMAK
jgi:hypothetical protein